MVQVVLNMIEVVATPASGFRIYNFFKTPKYGPLSILTEKNFDEYGFNNKLPYFKCLYKDVQI